MKEIIQLDMPLTKKDISRLEIGDVIELTGTVYTARDAAHRRMQDAFDAEEQQSADFKDQFIFYAGPCPTRPGRVMGSIAPTTSMRMDSFVEMTFQLGILGMIGKGDRTDEVAGLCKKYGGVYLLSIGGASAMISNQVKSCQVVAYEDLGTESVKRLEVEKLRLIVGIDSKGQVFQEKQIELYRR